MLDYHQEHRENPQVISMNGRMQVTLRPRLTAGAIVGFAIMGLIFSTFVAAGLAPEVLGAMAGTNLRFGSEDRLGCLLIGFLILVGLIGSISHEMMPTTVHLGDTELSCRRPPLPLIAPRHHLLADVERVSVEYPSEGPPCVAVSLRGRHRLCALCEVPDSLGGGEAAERVASILNAELDRVRRQTDKAKS